MSYQPPLPPGPGPAPGQGNGPGQGSGAFAPYGPPQQGAPPPYGAHPAYAGMPSPAPRSSGLNPWVAGLIGVLIGGIGAMVLSFVVPMIFFGLFMGAGFGGSFDEEGFMGGPQRVTVAADGSVSGTALAEALEEAEWYQGVTCPDTAKVATDISTICEGTDGFSGMRVVVVFEGTDGRFSTADLYE